MENKVSFEREIEIQAMLDKWKQKPVYTAEQIVIEVKKLKEFNEDCVDLDCSNKKCDDEKGLICLCEKLSGKFKQLDLRREAKLEIAEQL